MRIDCIDPVGHEDQGSVDHHMIEEQGDNESRESGGNKEPPDDSRNETARPGIRESAGPDDNEELKWARRHIPEEPAPPREPAQAPVPPRKSEPEEEPENPEPFQRMKPGRGKGRPPHRMLKEATAIAKKRGGVIPVPGGRSDTFDMIICEDSRNVFVRFRWSGTQYLSARDAITRYPRDTGRIVRMPQTGVMAWEFWLFEPGNTWQFFLFTHNGLVEIQGDGTIYYRPMLPVPAADSVGSSPGNGASRGGNEYGPGGNL